MPFLKRLFPSVVSRPIIALLSDFGTKDHYVGTMKGVVASINPSAVVIDIGHDVEPYQVLQGAYVLWSSYKFFPRGTVFVCVVDPGVGSSRRIVIVRTDKYLFVAPDNGLLDMVLADGDVIDCVEVDIRRSPFTLGDVSSTFHGRDVFAPVGAYLARGVRMEEFGPQTEMEVPQRALVQSNKTNRGKVLYIDRFGNMVTNIHVDVFSRVGSVTVRKTRIKQKIEAFADGTAGSPSLIMGSSGLIEIVMKNGNAARKLKSTAGDRLEIAWK